MSVAKLMLYSSIDALVESSYHYVTSCSGQPAAAFLALFTVRSSPRGVAEKRHVCLASADLYYQAALGIYVHVGLGLMALT